MAYDEMFALRIRAALGDRAIVEKKMFGGVGFMVNGNLCCGIYKNQLMLHVADEASEDLAQRTGATRFEMRERVMKGWVLVEPDAVKTQASLSKWLSHALKHIDTLPPKAVKKPAPRGKAKTK